ncbi:unnamed protein product, partial [Vitis vinifera]|uniref:Uncharacterized protein n=1 Tax=Vitis vinifera TaxID=29760 RepID=D7U700_VITVI
MQNICESHPSKLKLTSGAQNILVLVKVLNTALLTRYYTMKGALRIGELLLTSKKLNSFDSLGLEMMIVMSIQVNSRLITLNCL